MGYDNNKKKRYKWQIISHPSRESVRPTLVVCTTATTPRRLVNAVRRFRALTDAAEARAALPQLSSMLDRLAGKKIIHKNKAANLKSKLAKQIARLG